MLLPSTGAAITGCHAPPGVSGLDQYCESVPSAGGNQHHQKKPPPKVPTQAKSQLQQDGAAGQSVLSLTGQSSDSTPAPAPAPKHHRHHKHHAAQTQSKPAPAAKPPVEPTVRVSSPSDNPVSAVGSSFGVGSGLPWVLLAIALGMGAWMLVSRRRGGPAEN
jgi:hypothetical protein